MDLIQAVLSISLPTVVFCCKDTSEPADCFVSHQCVWGAHLCHTGVLCQSAQWTSTRAGRTRGEKLPVIPVLQRHLACQLGRKNYVFLIFFSSSARSLNPQCKLVPDSIILFYTIILLFFLHPMPHLCVPTKPQCSGFQVLLRWSHDREKIN